jgi:hypothetical protein
MNLVPIVNIINKIWNVTLYNHAKNVMYWKGYTESPRTASPEKKKEYLGKCDNLHFKEKKSYLKR